MRKRRINMQRNSNLTNQIKTKLATSPQQSTTQNQKQGNPHLHPLSQPQQPPKRPINLHTRHLLLPPWPGSPRLRPHPRPPQKHTLLLPRFPITPSSLPETQLNDNILHDGVGVQQHVDERRWEVEQAVFESGEEGDFGLGGGGWFAGG